MECNNVAEAKVIKFVQELLDDERKSGAAITLELISENIERVLSMKPQWGDGLDREAVTDELIRRFSTWVGEATAIHSDEDHKAWLVAARKQDWRYWQRYREYLERDWPLSAVDALDESTDKILGLLEDPARSDPWDRRGLVVGHVQSGKTGNYTGLVCKAADAGYKIIIILAGMHNNLRAQTQIRLDEGFLGFKSTGIADHLEIVGVGEIDSDQAIRPNFATNRAENGDFNTRVAKHLGITPEQRPWLFVVKKNKTVLKRLNEWIENHVANSQDFETGRKVVTNLPLLMIDDEADNASVDTGEQPFNDVGQPVEEYEPKAINSLIRKTLHSFTHSAYVGYTATPFANIFIHERGATALEGPDLFPAAFIVNLAAPSTHIGPSRIFGPKGEPEKGLPLLRPVSGAEDWLPSSHKNGHRPRYNGQDDLPPSLKEAILSFLISCAVRACRGQKSKHSSMLVHVTRFTVVQQHVFQQIEQYLQSVRQRLIRKIDNAALMAALHDLWDNEENGFLVTNSKMRDTETDLDIRPLPSFDAMMEALVELVQDVQVKTVNGTAKDALDYELNKETGLKVIAVGGDKLSRGLTLEGLSVSYFLRASKMYDTLMQMGRWFGYRPGYLDLCRLYIPDELAEWFRHITDANEELREEFDLAVDSGMTPREYGLKVQSHSTLMVTSRVKMRTAKELQLSFSGQLVQTVALHRDHSALLHNYNAAKELLGNMGASYVSPIERNRNGSHNSWDGYLWNNVPAEHVISFLEKYKSHTAAHRVNSSMLAEFISGMNAGGELTRWTVALIGSSTGQEHPLLPGIVTKLLQRGPLDGSTDKYSIGTLISPRDESIDLDNAAWNAALKLTRKTWHADPGRSRRKEEPDEPSGPSIRHIRGFGDESSQVGAHPERGLLLLYMLDPVHARLDGAPPVVALGLSFPGSRAGTKVKYKVNNVYWEQEYGPTA